jgi:hypothetical protein
MAYHAINNDASRYIRREPGTRLRFNLLILLANLLFIIETYFTPCERNSKFRTNLLEASQH